MWPPLISNDNKFTLKPIPVFLPFFKNLTYIHHFNEDHIAFSLLPCFRWAGWPGGGHETSPSAASEVQPAVRGAGCGVHSRKPKVDHYFLSSDNACFFSIIFFFLLPAVTAND